MGIVEFVYNVLFDGQLSSKHILKFVLFEKKKLNENQEIFIIN